MSNSRSPSFSRACPQCGTLFARRGLRPGQIVDHSPRLTDCHRTVCARCIQSGRPAQIGEVKRYKNKAHCPICDQIGSKYPAHRSDIMKTVRQERHQDLQFLAKLSKAERKPKRGKVQTSSASIAPLPSNGIQSVSTRAPGAPQPSAVFKPGWSVDKLALEIALSKEQVDKFQAVFVKVRTIIQGHMPCRPNVEKAGSFGMKIAIKDTSDIDNVVRFKNLETELDFFAWVREIYDTVLQYPDVFTNPTCNRWVVTCEVDGISVDLLPAPIVEDIAEFLALRGTDGFLSACASIENCKFIREQCGVYPKYRPVLECIKYWVNLHDWRWNGQVMQPKSFLLALVVLEVVARASQATSKEDLFVQVLELLAQRKRRLILHSEHHPTESILRQKDSKILNGFTPGSDMPDEQFHLVVDPMNPHNDVASKLRNASLLRKYATATLKNLAK